MTFQGQAKNSTGVFADFCVRNIGQAVAGRHEIEYAEQEMPGTFKATKSALSAVKSNLFQHCFLAGILSLRERAKQDAPLKGARIVGERVKRPFIPIKFVNCRGESGARSALGATRRVGWTRGVRVY